MSTDPADAAPHNGYDATELVAVTRAAMRDRALTLANALLGNRREEWLDSELVDGFVTRCLDRFEDAHEEYEAAYEIWMRSQLPDGTGRVRGAAAN